MHKKNKEAHAAAAKPPPPINLLAAQRPPLEIHKIEGDKIIIIRRVPKGHRICDEMEKHRALFASLPDAANQVKANALNMQCPNANANRAHCRCLCCSFVCRIRARAFGM